jgi:hypothetical protein
MMSDPTDAEVVAYALFKGMLLETGYTGSNRAFSVYTPDYVGFLNCNPTGTVNLPPEIRAAILDRMNKDAGK